MKPAAIGILASMLLLAGGVSAGQEGVRQNHTSGWSVFISKGGVGIVVKGLFVILDTDTNQLRLGDGATWKGKAATERQVVFVHDGKVIGADALPHDFNLADSLVISFESDRVSFYDFKEMSGGYYRRLETLPPAR